MGTFAGTAGFYARFRPAYPAVLWSTLATELRLDGTGRLLDLGTGPGVAALALLEYVGSVVAVDPEPEMLAEARAADPGASVEWVLGTAETFVAGPGSLRAATLGQSFHWMQRPLVLERLHRALEPGGGIAVFGGGNPAVDMLTSGPIGLAIGEVQTRWLGHPMARRTGIDGAAPHGEMIAASSFGAVREVRLPWRQQWTVEKLIGFLESTSWRPQDQLGPRFSDFAADLRAAILAVEPTGTWVLETSMEVLLARKAQ